MVGRCKLDPSLKATCFQPLNLIVRYSAFNLKPRFLSLHPYIMGNYKQAVKHFEFLNTRVMHDPGILARLGSLHAKFDDEAGQTAQARGPWILRKYHPVSDFEC